ncbi:NAD(P)/FAD-dependent oxidoreductase [Chachezhania antarctica]|uniref:NAD(P)/FAD-dependent oxidoreductase n=1 Tax=Chachezhania antarctica TaxID=2340860 RepID=UPI000EB1863B|nr:NAD(P)/FAD-dependent oxidoreductase [Chachezhania antarctica]|tara:strand:+ start:4490 stop:6217 length:1728 start_codon:yes stop_codon:yes gene_type:complete
MSIAVWVDDLNQALATGDASRIAALFHDDGLWRDFVTTGWTLQTVEGADRIGAFAAHAGDTGFSVAVAGDPDAEEGFIAVETEQGRGRGYVRLRDGKCATFFATLEELKGFEEPLRHRRPIGLYDDGDPRNWQERLADKAERWGETEQPYVLIVGGGQGGLALGARLEMLGVPYLIVDKHPSVGDQWRSRYKSLTLHDPVWYDHMPYMPFPDFWPVFTPKDRMGDWLEAYAHALELCVWTGTECTGAHHDGNGWVVDLLRNGAPVQMRPTHLVMAVGNAGFPQLPEIEGRADFTGEQLHSSAFTTGEGMAGKKVVIVGANNSAHDIAANLVENGAAPVMIQRSSTLIVRQETMTEVLLKQVYSQEAVDSGITTELADLLNASVPLRMQEANSKRTWDRIREEEAPFYDRLSASGFRIDFGEDGTGLMKYQRSASGYYIDVGACEMIVDGRIGIRAGANIARLVPEGVVLDSGEVLEADKIVYATGFGSMEQWVAKLIGPETAARIGRCWGYGSDTKGDPGPWEGELRNMWKPTAHEGLWFMGGNLAQARFYSRILGLQLKARLEGLPVTVRHGKV